MNQFSEDGLVEIRTREQEISLVVSRQASETASCDEDEMERMTASRGVVILILRCEPGLL